ncbi:MAG: hypothetical protein JW940_31215 [Polyangiaceae bacterium]|nr:hypothetical protein [Polyangiaceae bacterium]
MRPNDVTFVIQVTPMTSFHLRLNYLEGPGAPELELVAPAAMQVESRFLPWLRDQRMTPTAVNVVRTPHKVFASARLLDQDGAPAIPSRAADVMVYVRRCLVHLEAERSREPPELVRVSA